MAKGYFIRIGDKTTCGGTVLAGEPRHNLKGMATAREGVQGLSKERLTLLPQWVKYHHILGAQ